MKGSPIVSEILQQYTMEVHTLGSLLVLVLVSDIYCTIGMYNTRAGFGV